MSDCQKCKTLEAENKKLRKLVKLASKIIKKQRQQIGDVRGTCWTIMEQAKQEMSKHLPRGTWSLWKGRSEVASRVYGLVGPFLNW